MKFVFAKVLRMCQNVKTTKVKKIDEGVDNLFLSVYLRSTSSIKIKKKLIECNMTNQENREI
jgi:hypothetical protein